MTDLRSIAANTPPLETGSHAFFHGLFAERCDILLGQLGAVLPLARTMATQLNDPVAISQCIEAQAEYDRCMKDNP